MTLREAVDIAVQLMDAVPLKGEESRARGMAQAELMKALPVAEAAIKRAEKAKK